jgi:long-chain acyl-CoA synthetase
VRAQWWLADKLVYAKFRAGIGGRVRLFISGGGPLAPALAEFFNTVGIPVSQGYGLTETSPVISFSVKAPDHIGSSGHPIRDVEVRIADDGEILVRGPCVMMGYYKDPEATRAMISPDGWLATGDIGYLDQDGYLTITDRKKDILKTAGGKIIAPAPIENALKTSPYIQNAALVGDQRRFVAALIVPNCANLQALARERGLAAGSPAEICTQPWVRNLIETEIARLTANLAQYETIKRFALLERDFTFDGGDLTYTLKLKRREIGRRYANVIERLYAEPAPAHL